MLQRAMSVLLEKADEEADEEIERLALAEALDGEQLKVRAAVAKHQAQLGVYGFLAELRSAAYEKQM